jgi:hypothetical protein
MPNPDACASSLLHVTASLSPYRVSRNRDFYCNSSVVCGKPEMPNPDSFRSSDTCPSDRTAPTVSGNRGSRFHCARVSRLRKPRYPELRFSGISRHVSLLFEQLRSYREITDRDFNMHKTLVSGNPKMPNSESTGSLTTCPCRDQRLRFSVGVSRLERSQFSRLVKPRCLQNPDDFPVC